MSWVRTVCFYLTAFVGGALAWGGTFYLYQRYVAEMNVPPPDDMYYWSTKVIPILQNALPQLLAAIVLRVTARRMAWNKLWQWLTAGSAISLAIVWGFGQVGIAIEGSQLPLALQSLKMTVFFALMGPITASLLPLWVSVTAVALSSAMLWVVQHGVGGRRRV